MGSRNNQYETWPVFVTDLSDDDIASKIRELFTENSPFSDVIK